jgi:hypothetical protein
MAGIRSRAAALSSGGGLPLPDRCYRLNRRTLLAQRLAYAEDAYVSTGLMRRWQREHYVTVLGQLQQNAEHGLLRNFDALALQSLGYGGGF